ncbi:MAG: adenylosuccinate synthase [Chloroflexi bacterium]|mgnify:CR=1 FL=1|nr:adenylosuccinate synthase [Chloroflexota bacterium]
MPGTLIIGAQWGDEAKGKITDMLASKADIVARYQGGDNAGHTVVVGGQTWKFHLIPSGILYPRVLCVLGNGMVINPKRLWEELDSLSARGVDISPSRLKISRQAHLIMPYHLALDGASEAALGQAKIGTTKRGIGPAYMDKMSRQGLRAWDMLRPDFRQRVIRAVEQKNIWLERVYAEPTLDPQAVADEYAGYAERMRPYIADISPLLYDAYVAGKELLYEGGQGTLLDIDLGSYPYVTSSSASAGGAAAGLGIGPRCIDRIIGVAKSYQTRVGSGPFPTELLDEIGDHMVDRGAEFGTTTGRRRRCGWLDLATLRYSARVNGLTEIALTKLDVLSGLNRLRTCNAYQVGGETWTDWPADGEALEGCAPVYEELPGWEEDLAVSAWEELPAETRAYIAHIEQRVGVPVKLISVGPDRDQTIYR